MVRPRAVDATNDIGLLAAAVSAAIAGRIRDRIVADGFDDVRDSYGYVMQGLLAGDTTVTELASRLGVSAQAVSKAVNEMEHAGYVARTRGGADRRARPLQLTARGDALVDSSRRARRAVAREVSRWLGTRDEAEVVRLLQRVAERFGGLDELSARRLRPPGS